MIRKFIFIAAMAVSSLAASAGVYNVTANNLTDHEGSVAYLVNYDNDAKVDSVVIKNGSATFKGEIETPIAVRMIANDSRLAQFILETGTTSVDVVNRSTTGTLLNDRLAQYNAEFAAMAAEFQNTSDPDAQQGIYQRYLDGMKARIVENIDNPIGYIYFMDVAYEMAPAEFLSYLEKYPHFKNYKRVASLVEKNERKLATSEGKKYIDFDIDGKKLSDYVGKDGKYLLVDFWASWCGPCIRQTAVIKEIYAKHADKLNVLGVAVWDKPENTLKAIERHGLNWDCIINAQSIPTDLYGISGIPCIILIAPDGTILSRDKQSDELKADVDKYLAE